MQGGGHGLKEEQLSALQKFLPDSMERAAIDSFRKVSVKLSALPELHACVTVTAAQPSVSRCTSSLHAAFI